MTELEDLDVVGADGGRDVGQDIALKKTQVVGAEGLDLRVEARPANT